MAETTVFQSGNSQAVRLPKEFRFSSKTVEIFRRGNEVVLREKPRTMAEVLDALPPVTKAMAGEIEQVFAEGRDSRGPEARDWEALWGEASPSRAAGVRAKPAPSARVKRR